MSEPPLNRCDILKLAGATATGNSVTPVLCFTSQQSPIPFLQQQTSSSFTEGFYREVTTAAYRVKGAWEADSKEFFIWATIAHLPGEMENDDTSDAAIDHYRLPYNKTLLLIIIACTSVFVKAQEKKAANAQDLAVKLNNPVANLISVPFQNNLDYGIGIYNGAKYTLNFQPVVPFTVSPRLNLITRYIIPIVDQHGITAEGSHQFGLSDATVSAFFSPVGSKNGWIWGLGPAFLVPIGTDDFLSTRKWGIGPTALVLRQAKGLTYGFLTNQLWSFAGDEDRTDIDQMFLQPFFAYNWKSGAGVGLNSEITFNWEANTTNAFLNPTVSAVTTLGRQAISMALGPRIPLGGPEESKPDFGLRAVLTFVFPQ